MRCSQLESNTSMPAPNTGCTRWNQSISKQRENILQDKPIFRCNTPQFECCLKKISYICAVFRSNPLGRHTESVFALSLTENVAVFKRIKDNEQHSFLFRLCGKGVLYPAIPHIYSSVGYCIVYLIQVLLQPSVR